MVLAATSFEGTNFLLIFDAAATLAILSSVIFGLSQPRLDYSLG